MHSLWLDVRFALRMFRAHPVITFVAVVSLALGIGANSIMFSLVDGMFLRPLPVDNPDELLWIRSQTLEGRQTGMSWLDYLEVKELRPFSGVAVQNRRGGLLDGEGEAQLVLLTVVSDNYFPLLGVEAARGRLFRADLDASLQNEPAVVISDSLWRRRFGGDPEMVGRSIRMNKRSFTVVGILPAEFRGLDRAIRNDVWVPVSTWKAMGNRDEFESREPGQFEALARLSQNAGLRQAQAHLNGISRRLEEAHPGTHRGRSLVVFPEEMRGGGRAVNSSALLLSIVGLLVLIACANVALMLLAQAEGRRREVGIRLAVGAGRGRLVRQLLTESALLALMGGGGALAAAWWMIPLLPALLPPGPDFLQFDIRLDGRVLLVTILTCAATVVLFGLAPALEASRTNLSGVIKSGGWQARKRFAGRALLVISQAALAVVLLTAAGLLAQSFLNSHQRRLGFDAGRDTLVMLVTFTGRPSNVAADCELIAERLRALPGVTRVAYCRRMPLSGAGMGAARDVVIPGRGTEPGGGLLRIRYNLASEDFFPVTGTRLLAGRAFTRADSETGAQVVLVNQTMSRQFWPGGGPLGQWIRVDNVERQIVGVVENGVISQVHEPPEPFLYLPFAQAPDKELTFLIGTAGEPGAMLDAARREMRAAKPEIVMLMTNSLRQQVRDALYSDWLPAVLAAAVAALGMLLAAVGTFGVVMQGVTRRSRELGVRMALGASPLVLLVTVFRGGLSLAACGALAGAGISLAAGRLMAGMLHGVSPYDPLILTLSVGLVLAMAGAASVYPAWKASRVNPVEVLRAE